MRTMRSFANAFIVISDSDGETQEEKIAVQRRKAKQTVLKLEAKRKIAQMTEEEQLELAVRMSEQEASQVNYHQKEEEEELLRKAIAESLKSKPCSKRTRKKRATARLAFEEPTQLSQQEENNSDCSVTTSPDSQPLSEHSLQLPTDKPTSQLVSGASFSSPDKNPTLAPQSGSLSLLPIKKLTAQLQHDAICASPIRKPPSQPLDGGSCASPGRKSGSEALGGASCVSPVRKPPPSQLLDGVNCALPHRKFGSQVLDGASCDSPLRTSGSQALVGACSVSPVRRTPPSQRLVEANCPSHNMKCGSQPLSGVSCLSSPIRRPCSQPMDGASCLSPVRRLPSQPLGAISCLSSPARMPASQHMSGEGCLSHTRKPASLDDLEPHTPVRMSDSESPTQGGRSPVVLLERLSQDIVESPSIVLSPAGSSTFSALSQDPTSPTLTEPGNVVPVSPLVQHFAMSPTFPRRSPCIRQQAPRRLMSSLARRRGMVEEDREEVNLDCAGPDSMSGGSTFGHLQDLDASSLPEQRGSRRSQGTSGAECHRRTLETSALQPLTLRASLEQCPKPQDEGTVHYYWGVPFCPKGVNPNQYTQVVLCQLEVYQKSLKRAQKQLLQKKEYGPPILPSAPSSRRCRGGQRDEGSRENAWGARGVQEGPVSDNSQESSQSPAAEERAAPTEDGPTTSYMQPSYIEETPGVSAGNGDDDIDGEPMQETPSASALSCDVEQGSPEGAGTQKENEGEGEEEVTVCPETQSSLSSDTDIDGGPLPRTETSSPSQSCPDVRVEEAEPTIDDVESTVPGVQPPVADIEPTVTDVDLAVADIQCPLCENNYAPEQIVLHAAYCDGSIAKQDERLEAPVLTRRQRGMRSTAVDMGASLSSADTGKRKPLNKRSPVLQFPCQDNREKCYLCKEMVPIREYQGHVEICLQKASVCTEGSPRLYSTKVGQTNGRLLSMLDQSESMSADAEARTSAPGPGALRAQAHSGNKEEDRPIMPSSPEDFTAPLLSNSPIKSFVSISEATDCLLDFKQQFNKVPSRGRGRGQVRGASRRSRSRSWRGKRR